MNKPAFVVFGPLLALTQHQYVASGVKHTDYDGAETCGSCCTAWLSEILDPDFILIISDANTISA